MRHDDHEKKCHFRSAERVFNLNGAWYFTTREGEEGPFTSEGEAKREIDRYIGGSAELVSFQQARQAQNAKPKSYTLELVDLDERPHTRKSTPEPINRRVHL